jgi:cell division protein FtsN
MRKYMVLCAGLCVTLVITSCGSMKESAYKKAYEKAKQQENTQASTLTGDTAVAVAVTPLVKKPANDTKIVDNYDNVQVRQENVTIVNGSGLKGYSVVVGSFGLKTNAEGLQSQLKVAGYDAQLAFNAERNMYRVIASTFTDKQSAARSRDEFRSKYPDAWLLYNKK